MSQGSRQGSAKRRRTKGWGKRKGFNGDHANNEYSDADDKEELHVAIAGAYAQLEAAKEFDKTSFPEETDEERLQRLEPYSNGDGTYDFRGVTTYLWNDVEWALTYHLGGWTGVKGTFPTLLRRQCTMEEKNTLIEMGIMAKNLRAMNCSAYIWREAEELVKTHFPQHHEDAIKKGYICRRVFSGGSQDIYEGIYNGDKDAPIPSADGTSMSFGRKRHKAAPEADQPKGLVNPDNVDAVKAAMQSTRDFNSELRHDRNGLRQVFYDPHTRLVQVPKMFSVELIERQTKEDKLYPAAALPNQYVAAYTKYTPEEMSMLPVDTITKWHITPAELFPAEGEDSEDEAGTRQSDDDDPDRE